MTPIKLLIDISYHLPQVVARVNCGYLFRFVQRIFGCIDAYGDFDTFAGFEILCPKSAIECAARDTRSFSVFRER